MWDLGENPHTHTPLLISFPLLHRIPKAVNLMKRKGFFGPRVSQVRDQLYLAVGLIARQDPPSVRRSRWCHQEKHMGRKRETGA